MKTKRVVKYCDCKTQIDNRGWVYKDATIYYPDTTIMCPVCGSILKEEITHFT